MSGGKDSLGQLVPKVRSLKILDTTATSITLQALVNVTVQGRLRLPERAHLEATLADMADDFAHFEHDLQALEIEQEAGDLDEIDRGGALRQAANSLFARAEDGTLSEEDRRVARLALARLYQFAVESRA